MRILITEDNGELAEFIQEAFLREGYLSDIALTIAEQSHCLNSNAYSVIVLDLGLPDGDGMLALKALRKRGVNVPVLILTARGSIQDRIKGLDLGADDYLSKPFAIDELVARTRALLRRPSDLSTESLISGNVSLDIVGKAVAVDGKNVQMGRTEFSVLECLIRNEKFTVSKEKLESSIYQYADEITDNALQVAVHRVRKKLKENSASITIKSIRGVGYLLQ